VISHEAIANYFDGVEMAVVLQQTKVDVAVGGREKEIAALIAALSNVVRAFGHHDAGRIGAHTVTEPVESTLSARSGKSPSVPICHS
jgi:hypothetical protein